MKKLIDYLSSETGILNKPLLEKDVILHLLLGELSKNDYFSKSFVFKGGTCLIKCYYGYYRFSEDLDFSFANQAEFEGKSQKEVRRALSMKLNDLISILNGIAGKLHLEFKEEKSSQRYIEFGGSSKFTTFKLWYKSTVSGNEQFVKVQINFVEHFFYNFRKLAAKSLIKGIENKEFSFLFPEYKILLEDNIVAAYDIKEILIEKCRAVLTRRGVKARDLIDIYLILHNEKLDIADFRGKVIDKTKFMLRYVKYLQNLNDFDAEKFLLGEEEKLLLKPLHNGFESFVKEVTRFLVSLAKEIKHKQVLRLKSQ